MPEMHFVTSSNIEAIGYDAPTMALYVRFLQSGETYIYYNVESWVFDQFIQADSKGKYLHDWIKPNYPYAKL